MAKTSYKMIKEIKEQPQVVKSIINKHVKGKKIVFNKLDDTICDLLKINRFIFLGCGSSYHAALYGNLVFEEIAKLNCEAEFADEFNKRNPVIERGTAIVVLSQSGETKEVLKAIKIAKRRRALIVGITNNKNSIIAKTVDIHIDLAAGKEVAVPATKTFSSQLLILILLALFIKQGNKQALKYINDVKKLPKLIKRVIVNEKKIKDLVAELDSKQKLIILGHKFNYPIALEGSLKLKEAAGIFAEGMATAEFEHGPKALSDKVSLARINGRSLEINKKKISVPQISEALLPILLIAPLQFLAYHLAILKNINPDQPSRIKKFVK